MSSTKEVNLTGTRKANALVVAFGEKGFDYVGNSSPDLHVWRKANAAITVGDFGDTLARKNIGVPIVKHFPSNQSGIRNVIKLMRIHQWAKNLLLLAPLILAHKFSDTEKLLATLTAFVGMSLCASGGYVLNDLLDLEADRMHKDKCKRPLAAKRS